MYRIDRGCKLPLFLQLYEYLPLVESIEACFLSIAAVISFVILAPWNILEKWNRGAARGARSGVTNQKDAQGVFTASN